MTSPLTTPSLFAWTAPAPILAGLLLVGCSNGDSTSPAPEASPRVTETDNPAPPP